MGLHISDELRLQIRHDSQAMCGYCQTQEAIIGLPLQIDHILPTSKGGGTIRENLWLACVTCNRQKSNSTHYPDPETNTESPLFNPRQDSWGAHFQWDDSNIRIIGITPTGRATIACLDMNNALIVRARFRWVQAGWHPPSE